MIWTNLFKLILISVIFSNITIIFFTNLIEPGSKAVILASLIITLITLPIIIFVFFQKGKLLVINAAFLGAFLIILEIAFYFRIVQHPAFTTWRISSNNKNSVEFLDNQPFVKFKPNVTVRSQGNRGDDFVYEWVSDQYGYKNKPFEDFENKIFDFIALGNSFTEAMGVTTSDTWASQVDSMSEYQIYNAGVQGYSASQMRATYEYLQKKILHKGIIIGTSPSIYTREAKFIEKNNKPLFGRGGIHTIAAGKTGGNSFLVQFMRAVKNRYNASRDIFQKRNKIKYNSNEIPRKYLLAEELLLNHNWIIYTENIVKLAKKNLEQGKKVILIKFPNRHEVYKNLDELGVKNINEIRYYIQLNLLKKSLPEEVVILDMFPYIKEKLKNNDQLIYFKNDGHMNEKGNKIIAEYLLKNFKKVQ